MTFLKLIVICTLEYENMKQKLGEFMKEKSQGDKIIRKEDIQDFFEGLHAAKRRRLDSNEDNF